MFFALPGLPVQLLICIASAYCYSFLMLNKFPRYNLSAVARGTWIVLAEAGGTCE